MATQPNESKDEEIPPISWEEFEEKIKKEPGLFESKRQSVKSVLFRGHAKESWGLSTTLERYLENKDCANKVCSLRDYWTFLRNVKFALSSLTSNK
jgi:hypothetical protein